MFADAVREVRFHPGRVIATLIAIAISVAFMVASSTFITTQQHSIGKQLALQASNADLLVTGQDPELFDTIAAALTDVPGVAQAEESRQTGGPLRSDTASVMSVLYVVPSEAFRWSSISEGAWPTTATQIAVSEEAAKKLGVSVGDTVTSGGVDLTVVGLTNDPRSIFQQTAYIAPALADTMGMGSSGQWLVKAADGTDIDALKDTVAAATSSLGTTVTTADAYSAEQLDALTSETNVMKLMLGGFAGVALVVGMIIIANTFTILLAQRRRQIGLLRAVGASGSQVRRKFLAEAILLGVLGSALGIVLGVIVAIIGSWFVGTLSLGVAIPWLEVGGEFLVGVLITVLAAIVPVIRSTRVAPLEALQPVQTVEAARASSRVRLVICGLLVVVGAAMAVFSQFNDAWPLVWALGGAMLLTLGVLGGAPLYVPSLLKVFGRVVGLTGPTARLAATNAVRNPGRASATATALMLAVGLIVTLQVGTATIEKTVLAKIDENYPVDISLAATDDWMVSETPDLAKAPTLPASVIADAKAISGVKATAVLQGTRATDQNSTWWSLSALDADAAAAAPTAPDSIADGVILVGVTDDPYLKKGNTLTLTGPEGEVKLTIQQTNLVEYQNALVSPATIAALTDAPVANLMWINLADRGDMAAAFLDLEPIMTEYVSSVATGGGALMAYMIERVLGILLLITSALLGVAVAIALIGVSNTLGLSVIERTRESALLRAMGMQKSSLRLMLLVEALLLALTGVLVGVGAGAFFGWLGISAVLRQADLVDTTLRFDINPWMTLAMIAIAAVAAALASILPGRRAANAAPVEALAEE